jgi:hypothetical protein
VKLWIDADACPRAIKEIIFRAATRRNVQAWVVANRALALPRSPWILLRQVGSGPDEADNYIVENSSPDDIAVTADIPLAARLVEKGLAVLDPRGEEYSAENIGERLSLRNWMHEMRESGLETGGPSAFGAREARLFASAFDSLLARKLR